MWDLHIEMSGLELDDIPYAFVLEAPAAFVQVLLGHNAAGGGGAAARPASPPMWIRQSGTPDTVPTACLKQVTCEHVSLNLARFFLLDPV